jgi:Xaa-Pro dipeptidase
VARGADPLLGDVGIGERGALVDFVPGDRELRRGDVIRFDVGCTLAGYHADLARTATFGPTPQWVRDDHAALVAGQEAALQALRPGATGAALFTVAVEATRAAGRRDYERTHCGHGIGLDIYEPPLVAPGHDEPLAAGMALCVETPLYLTGLAGLQIEDAVVVTETGHERLGALPRTLLTAD